MHGIVNNPKAGTMTEDEEFSSIVKASDKYGLTVIILGPDVDMDSTLIKRLRELEQLKIRQCFDAKDEPSKENLRPHGPRDRWGTLK